LVKGIALEPLIEVVAEAVDPYDARDKILQYKPDVMTCDIQMPKMNGIEFIRRLLPQYPLPVIVVSTVSDAVFNAMNAGAVDFVAKPDAQSLKSVDCFINELIKKIKTASMAKVSRVISENRAASATARIDAGNVTVRTKNDVNNGTTKMKKIIAIGASTGGTEAIFQILKGLPQSVPGIIITQHIPPVFSKMFAERLNKLTQLEVKEAETGDYIEAGKVFVAPGDRHMKIKKVGDRFKVECFEGSKVNGHCPSVDVLFESVAKEAGEQAIGIILTGMGYDGAKGLLMMKRKGAITVGQDEKTSVVYGMPKAAYDIGAVEKQVSLESIPECLNYILKKCNRS
jgi:two-component system chemotaxis response regulator CheB